MPAVSARIILRTFNGTQTPPPDCAPEDNYWRLIGETGTVLEAENARGRVLVRFDLPPARHGLHCHNPLPDSLYILVSDLALVTPLGGE